MDLDASGNDSCDSAWIRLIVVVICGFGVDLIDSGKDLYDLAWSLVSVVVC